MYIYFIKNTITNNFYVGSSIEPEKRLHRHFYELRKGVHSNTYLQRAFDKYGESSLQTEYYKSIYDTRQEEQEIIDESFDSGILYNLSRNVVLSDLEAHRKNLSESLKGRDKNIGFTGKKHTKDTKIKMSLKHKGRVFTDEHKDKIRKSLKGQKFSDERKKNISKSCKNRTHKNLVRYKIDGVIYESSKDAALKLGVSTGTILYWFRTGRDNIERLGSIKEKELGIDDMYKNKRR